MYPDLSGADRFVTIAVVVAAVLHVVAAVAALRWARRCAGNLPGLTTEGAAPRVRWAWPASLLPALWRVGIAGARPPAVVPAAGAAILVAALGWCVAVPAAVAIGHHAPDPSEAADFVLLVAALLDAGAALLLANVVARISTRQDARARKLAAAG